MPRTKRAQGRRTPDTLEEDKEYPPVHTPRMHCESTRTPSWNTPEQCLQALLGHVKTVPMHPRTNER